MKIRKVTRPSGAVRYQVDLGKVGKNRVQKLFRTKQEAQNSLDAAKAKQKTEGNQGLALSEGDRIRFLDAKERLAAVGSTIEEAVSFFLAHTKPESGPLPVDKLALACVQAKRQENKWERYLGNLLQIRSPGPEAGGRFGDARSCRQRHPRTHPHDEGAFE